MTSGASLPWVHLPQLPPPDRLLLQQHLLLRPAVPAVPSPLPRLAPPCHHLLGLPRHLLQPAVAVPQQRRQRVRAHLSAALPPELGCSARPGGLLLLAQPLPPSALLVRRRPRLSAHALPPLLAPTPPVQPPPLPQLPLVLLQKPAPPAPQPLAAPAWPLLQAPQQGWPPALLLLQGQRLQWHLLAAQQAVVVVGLQLQQQLLLPAMGRLAG